MSAALFLYLGKFVIFKLELIANVNTEGEQGDGNFRYNARIVVEDEGIVATDINDCADHGSISFEKPPRLPGAVII
jgi:hypothetical protein